MERQASGLKLQLGEKAPYFSLKGTDGKIHNLSDYVAKDHTSKKGLVVVFTCNHCPYAQAYEQRLITLALNYQEKGIQFVAICSNDSAGYPQDDFDHMVEKSKELSLPYPYLHDITQSVAKAYDAACTPEVYLFDSEQKLCYHGRIDDNHRDPKSVEHHDLRNALEAVLSGQPPESPMTSAIGCSIKWKR